VSRGPLVKAVLVDGPTRGHWRNVGVWLDLESLQASICGLIEALHYEEYTLIFDEEGLLKKLEPTLAPIFGSDFELVGPVLVLGPLNGSNWTAVTDAALAAFERQWQPVLSLTGRPHPRPGRAGRPQG